jgi:hypothetical protein
MISAPNVQWITCVNGVIGDNIGGSAPVFLQWSDNTLSDPANTATIPTLGIPIDCKIVKMTIAFVASDTQPFAFNAGGFLDFTLGTVSVGQPPIAANFLPIPGAPVTRWDTSLNGTWPANFLDMDVQLLAGQMLCMRSQRSAATMITGGTAELAVSMWLRGSTDPNSLALP